jgi:hypothetical protein
MGSALGEQENSIEECQCLPIALSGLMGVGQLPAYTVGDEFDLDRESDYLYGSVAVHSVRRSRRTHRRRK